MRWLQTKVSGAKARYVDGGYDLDLVYINERLIIMGYPAKSTESIYRNSRSEVRRFLREKHSDNFHIFNFCPEYENKYDAAYFNNQVSRFPFPDHHPPPLDLIPLFVDAITKYMATSANATSVIHCKAGKGRSGTMTCAYLLTTDLSGANTDLVESAEEVADNDTDLSPSKKEAVSIADKLASVYDLHTKNRMKATTSKRGVSIPSQRRFLGYWSRILDGQDPRRHSSANYNLTSIEITTTQESRQNFSVIISSYRKSITAGLSDQAHLLHKANDASTPFTMDNYDFQDGISMFETQGFLKSQRPLKKGRNKRLLPQAPMEVDANGELRVKVLWTSHLAALPSVASLGYAWIIPSFEANGQRSFQVTIPKEEIDFYKSFSHIESITVHFNQV